MKTKTKTKVLGTVTLGLALLSLPLSAGAFFHERQALVEARTLVGSPVRSSEGKEMGHIKQLLINPEDGEIVYAVVARGGILGFGEELIAIPWDDVKVARDRETVVLTVDSEVLRKAARVEEGKDIEMKGRETQPQEQAKEQQ